ncbi:bestrophin-like domain [Thermomonospora amylolytica]|uniref:bestrophin-like domain n=1 Tax=Thermomonospora amylolytica TaxID=1411117 RepID=UPI000E6B616F|nr:DUF4239 domain-containing protein [Thermomonospora amylolytica]
MLFYVLAAVAAIGVVLVAARLMRGTPDPHPDGPAAGHSGAMLAALFLLAFAIAVVVPWSTNDAARQNTQDEGQAVAEAYWTAARLPSPARERVQADLRRYVDLVRGGEWRLMAEGRLSAEGWAYLERVRREIAAAPAADDDAREVRSAALERIREVSAARRRRAVDAATTPPPGLLAITVLTGLAVVFFPFLAGARPRGAALVPLATMAALLAVGLYLVFDISRVFTGALAVEPDAFDNVAAELRRVPAAGG